MKEDITIRTKEKNSYQVHIFHNLTGFCGTKGKNLSREQRC